jgi:hypothetical protein
MKSPLEQKKEMIEQLKRLGGVGEQRRIVEYAQAPFVPHQVRRRLAGGGVTLSASQQTQIEYAILANSAGIWRTNYEGYHDENASFFDTAGLKIGAYAFNGADNDVYEPALPNSTSMMLKGYFKASVTGVHTIYVASDDGAYAWFGEKARTTWTIANADIANGGLHPVQEISNTVTLNAGEYTPLRVMFGNGPEGPGVLQVSYSHTGQAKTSDFTGKIFYNAATQGF